MRILVTGSEGQLARSIQARAIQFADLDLQLVSRPAFDLTNSESIRSIIMEAAPDVVINAAAYTAVDRAEDEPELAFQINARGAEAVAAAAASVGARVIQVSTDYVFDGEEPGAYAEDSPTNPLGVYGQSKLEGERRVRAATPDHIILRTAWVYSPFRQNFVKSIMSAAQTRDRLQVVADQVGNPTSAFDIADGVLKMSAAKSWGKTYHLAGTGTASWYEFAREIMTQCQLLGLASVPVDPILTAAWPTRARRPANSMLSCDKFRSDFGFVMPDWRASLRTVIRNLAARTS